MTVHIVTDSTADLGAALAEQFHIQVIPLYVHVDGKTFTDGVDVSFRDIFNFVSQTGQLPKTSAPSVPDFHKVFEQPGDIVYIGLSSKLSATHQNALLARDNCSKNGIYILDSLNLSTGIGLLAMKAAGLRDQGCSAEEVYRRVSEMAPKVRTSFMIETLQYLHKGGRCTALQSLASSLLSIRPIIAVQPDGTLGVKAKTRGTRRKGLQVLLDDFAQDLPQVDLSHVFITHTGCDENAQFLKNALAGLATIEHIHITYASSVIASHCGPDTVGILYLLK